MSPTVLREQGYRIIIYYNDHEPAHVHVKKDKNEVRIQLEPIQIMDNHRFKPNEIKTILRLIEKYQTLLLDTWNAIHPADNSENDEDVTE